MKTLRKILLVCSLLIALAVAAIIALFLILTNPNHLKAQVSQQVYAQTGLHLQINGKVSWLLAPQFGVSFGDVELKQPLAFDHNSSVKSPQVDVFIAVHPLFSRQIKIEKIVLHHFSLVFTKNLAKNPRNIVIGGDLQLTLPAQDLTIDPLTIDSGDIHAIGKLSGQNVLQTLAFSGQLKIPQLDLAHELQPFLGISDLVGKLKDCVINFHFAPATGMTGDFSSTNLILNHLNLTQVTAQFTANQRGKIQLLNINGALANGKIAGQVSITDLLTSPQYQLNMSLSHVELSQLLQSGILQGPADLTAQLTTSGVTNTAIMTNLNGALKLAAYNGILNHIDLLKQIRAVRQFLQANPQVASSADVTHFSQLTASGAINQGLFTNNDFILQSPDLQATGAGAINLINKQINYRLQVKAQGKLLDNAYNLSVPLKIGGTLEKPKVKIDLGALTVSVQPTPDPSKQLGRALHNEIKTLFGHHQAAAQ